jgi:hypothetical protein
MENGHWNGLLVICPSIVQRPMLEALLRAGVRAIVAPWSSEGGEDLNTDAQEEGSRMMIRAMSSARLSALVSGQEESQEAGQAGGKGEGPAATVPEKGSNGAMRELGMPEEASDDAVLAFFSALYSSLLGGKAVISSIEAGEAAAPELEGFYACYHL